MKVDWFDGLVASGQLAEPTSRVVDRDLLLVEWTHHTVTLQASVSQDSEFIFACTELSYLRLKRKHKFAEGYLPWRDFLNRSWQDYQAYIAGHSNMNVREDVNDTGHRLYLWTLGKVDGGHSLPEGIDMSPTLLFELARHAHHIGSPSLRSFLPYPIWSEGALWHHEELARAMVDLGLNVRPFIVRHRIQLDYFEDLLRGTAPPADGPTLWDHLE